MTETIRINNDDLEAVCDQINRETRSPMKTWRKDDNDHLLANVGNYHLSGACGGVSLHRMVNEHGDVEDVFRCGYISKRDLYYRMHAYLDGIAAVS